MLNDTLVEKFFAYEHLPEYLQEISKPFGDLARDISKKFGGHVEGQVAIRKLLEAKDAAVRAKLTT